MSSSSGTCFVRSRVKPWSCDPGLGRLERSVTEAYARCDGLHSRAYGATMRGTRFDVRRAVSIDGEVERWVDSR